MQALQTLGNQVTSQIQQSAGVQQGARVAGLQSAVQQAAAGGARATAGQVQATGAAQTAQAGAIGTQAAQLGQERLGQVGAMGLQEQYMASQQGLAEKKLQLDKESRAITDKLASVSLGLKTELMDKQQRFAQDALGRTLFNERQLMDWQVQKAKSHEDLLAYEQQVSQMSELRMATLKQSYEVITSAMKNSSEAWNQALDDQQKQRLAAAKQALEKKIADEKAAQANRAAMFEGVGAIVGAVVGGVVSGGVGAAAGASVGAGLGGAVAGATQ